MHEYFADTGEYIEEVYRVIDLVGAEGFDELLVDLETRHGRSLTTAEAAALFMNAAEILVGFGILSTVWNGDASGIRLGKRMLVLAENGVINDPHSEP